MKDKYSVFIEDSVYYSKNDYWKHSFNTKKLFFESLKNGTPADEFNKILKDIWGNIDHSYMEQRIRELEAMIDSDNGIKVEDFNKKFNEIFDKVPISELKEVELKFAKEISRYYEKRLETVNNGYVDVDTYLTNLVDKYDKQQNTIPYFNKDGTIHSYRNIADYNSMVFNSNLNKSGWNRTLYDAELLENDLVYLPAHPFACPLCMEWQGGIYSVSGKSKKYQPMERAIKGGVGHPNCKHQWVIYWDKSQVQKNIYDSDEWVEKYDNKQKINALQLEKKRLKTDNDVYSMLDNQEKVDKNKQRINAINSKIRELKP